MAEIIERVVATGDAEMDAQAGLSVNAASENPGYLTQAQIDAREARAAEYLKGATQGNVASVKVEGEAVLVRRVEVSEDEKPEGEPVVTVAADEFQTRERERVSEEAPSGQPQASDINADTNTGKSSADGVQTTTTTDAGDRPANAATDAALEPDAAPAGEDTGEGTARVTAQVEDFGATRTSTQSDE